MGVRRFARAARLFPLGAAFGAVLAMAGCSGGFSGFELPSLPSLPSLSAAEPEAEGSAADPAQAAPRTDIAELMKPGPLGDRSLGKATAPVTVIEYVSLTCPICARYRAETYPKFKKAYIDTGKVNYIFREYPIGQSAAAAAIAVRCAPEKAYFSLTEKLLAQQTKWVAQDVNHDDIYKMVQTSGLKRDKYDACFTDQTINNALYEVKQRGRAFGVSGTPAFFINGQRVSGAMSFEEMSKLVDAAIAAQQAQQPQQQAQASRPDATLR
jgi:protein-disulfide isomerase